MAIPSDSGPPKKPGDGAPKPPGAKPGIPVGKPAGGPPVKPTAPLPGKPAPGKPLPVKPTPPVAGKPAPPAAPKPAPEAIHLVPETMSSVYKVLPLTYKDNVLTVVMGDPNNLTSLDDLRSFVGVTEIVACLAPQAAIDEVLTKCYLGKEESIMDII